MVVASVLLGAAVVRHFAVVNPSAARRAALENTVVRLRECSRRKGPGSSSSVSEGRTSSTVCSSSVAAEQIAAAIDAMGRTNVKHQVEVCTAPVSQHGLHGTTEEFGSNIDLQNNEERDKPASCQPAILLDQDANDGSRLMFLGSGQSPEMVQNLELSNPFAPSVDQQVFDLNLALVFQERMNDSLFSSMLQHRSPEFVARGGEQELTTLLQDKGLDPNFAVMLKEKGLDPTILALLQRSSLDAGRERADTNGEIATGGNQSQILVLEEPISLSEELRRHQWSKWVQQMHWFIQLFAGTPERVWILFSVIFVVESVFVAVFRPSTVTVINATHEQVSFPCNFWSSCDRGERTTSLDLPELSDMRHAYLRQKWNRHGTKEVVVVAHHLIFFSVGCSTHGLTYHVECQALLWSFPFACSLNLGLQHYYFPQFWALFWPSCVHWEQRKWCSQRECARYNFC